MVSIKTILILNLVILSLALIYYFRVEITGFAAAAFSTIMLSISGIDITISASTNQSSYCFGEAVNLSNNVKIKELTSIGQNVSIGEDSVIEKSVLWDEITVGADVHRGRCSDTDAYKCRRGRS